MGGGGSLPVGVVGAGVGRVESGLPEVPAFAVSSKSRVGCGGGWGAASIVVGAREG